MKIRPGLFIILSLFFASCNTASPEKYFDRAVLSSNMLVGFADEGELRQLESPSVKADANGNPVPMKRNEVVTDRIAWLEEAQEKLKELTATDETKEMLETAAAIYELALPVYKTEYTELARLYDEGASKEAIQAQSKQIHDKYYDQYNELYTKLIRIGKVYAEKHAIKVNWNVGT